MTKYTVKNYKNGPIFIVFDREVLKIVCNEKGNFKFFKSEQAALDWVAANA